MTTLSGGAVLIGHLAYCGAPPSPATLLSRWNLDPVLMVVLAMIVVGYALIFQVDPSRRSATRPWRRACFYVGWALGAAALISPLCPLSVSLFSARVGQHMILEMIVAPLIALGLSPATPPRGRRPPAAAARWLSASPLAASGAFAAALWFWHAPDPYAATFASAPVYWLMHLTTFAAALWLWVALLAAARDRLGEFLAAALITTLQMGFLGALITFARSPVYRVHWLTTAAWNLSPLQDQQLGGVIMWIPAGGVLLAAIVAAMAVAMVRSGTPAQAGA